MFADADERDDLVVDSTSRWSSAAIETAVAHVAGGLREVGVARGDAVAWRASNRVESVLAYRACWRLGAVAAPLHHRAGDAEVTAILDRVAPRVVLDLDDLPSGAPVLAARSAAEPADLAVVLFTSGSGGRPKGVLHTHRGLAHKARLMAALHGLTPADATLVPAPLAHVSGLLNGVLVPAVVPMKTVLMERWNPERALGLIAEERITFMIGPPTFFVELLGAPSFRPESVDTLRLVSSGGAGVSPAFVREAGERLGCRVKRTYGSTEAPTVATTGPDDPQERATTTDGRVTGAAELRIGDGGELLVRGPEVFEGYLDPQDNADAFVDGWFRTGDLATLDDAGWLTIVGRLRDVIIRGGENVDPAEVEAVLEGHPTVRQAVVVGEADDRLGERIAAFVVVTAPFDLEECRAWVEAQGLARFKAPARVVTLGSVPTLAAGKPDRAALKAMLTDDNAG